VHRPGDGRALTVGADGIQVALSADDEMIPAGIGGGVDAPYGRGKDRVRQSRLDLLCRCGLSDCNTYQGNCRGCGAPADQKSHQS
jgi:hypothetical protein